jgi:cation diffusion facilitator CzcD-associated flavoprotein CzcO
LPQLARNGKSSTQFVRKEDLAMVRQQLRNYQQLRELIDRWITLGMELSRLKLASARLSAVSRKPPRGQRLAKRG